MNKVTMNYNQRPSFYFNRHKIFLVIRWGRPIKVDSIITPNEPSNKTIWKQKKKREQIKIRNLLYTLKSCTWGKKPYFFEIQEWPKGSRLQLLHLLELAIDRCKFQVQYKETRCPGEELPHLLYLVAVKIRSQLSMTGNSVYNKIQFTGQQFRTSSQTIQYSNIHLLTRLVVSFSALQEIQKFTFPFWRKK